MTIQEIITTLTDQIDLTITYSSSNGHYSISASRDGVVSVFKLRSTALPTMSEIDVSLIRDRLIIDWALSRYRRFKD